MKVGMVGAGATGLQMARILAAQKKIGIVADALNAVAETSKALEYVGAAAARMSKKQKKDILLADLALLLIDETAPGSDIARSIAMQRSRIVKRWGEAFGDIAKLKNVMVVLAEKLAACENVEMVALTTGAIEAINSRNMYIAEDDQLPG